jgi:hypothetical protein
MSLITIDVVDNANGQPLPGASVSVNGKAYGQTNGDGVIDVDCGDSDMVTISYVGYDTYSMIAGVIEESGQVQLSKNGSALPAVVVTPAKTTGLVGLAVVGGILLLSSSRKKKMSGVSKKQGVGIAVGLLAVGGIYLLTKKSAATNVQQQPNAPFVPAGGAQKPILQQGGNVLTAGSGILNSILKLFGGGASQPSSPAYTPIGIDPGVSNQPIDVAGQYNTLDPNAGGTLDFSGAPQAPADDVYNPMGDFSLSGFKKKIGDAADTFNAGDVIGKTLIANKTISIYDYPGDSSTPVSTVAAGQPVGVVYSYLDADATEDRKELWWIFMDGFGNYSYTPHAEGNFNISSLVQQGVQTQQQKDEATKPWYEQAVDKYLPWVIIGAVALGLGKKVIEKEL